MERRSALPWFYRNSHQLFWMLQLFGWIAVALAELCLRISLERTNHYLYALESLNHAFLGMIISLPLRLLFNYFWSYGLATRLFVAIAGVLVCSVLWHYTVMSSGEMAFVQWEYVSYFWFGVALLTYSYWTFLYHSIKYYQISTGHHKILQQIASDNQYEQLKRSQAEAVAREAQLKMLRYQLNPHFLFNTLNAISALVRIKQSTKANGMIVQLSNFLRYSLDNDPIQTVSLLQELDALKLYLNIEKMRFGNRLILNFDIQRECDHIPVPSLILQPLVENAIKHGIAPNERGGKLSVRASLDTSFMTIEITDTGPGRAKTNVAAKRQASSGIGLRNTRDRLQAFYGDRYEFNLESAADGGFRVEIKLPLES